MILYIHLLCSLALFLIFCAIHQDVQGATEQITDGSTHQPIVSGKIMFDILFLSMNTVKIIK